MLRNPALLIFLLLLTISNTLFPQVYASQASITDFEGIKSQSGQVILRFEMKSTGPEPVLDYCLSVKDATIGRIAPWFFEEGEDSLDADKQSWTSKASYRYVQCMPMNEIDVDVVTVWLNDASTQTRVDLRVNGETLAFTLGQLFRDVEYKAQVESVDILADLLLDKEMGELGPASVGITDNRDDFDFIIWADTHAGRKNDLVNVYIKKIVKQVNRLGPAPAFVMDIGDVVTAQGEAENFAELASLLKPLHVPFLMMAGNHESRYKSDFYPGYNMDAFENYFNAQKEINGMDELLYSFNLGKWHFIAMPDPHRDYFFQKHPHYFDWLDKDLAKHKDRPTIVFQHVHSLPLGINPMTSYVNSPQIMAHFLDCLTRYGNVKYLFSGHTHGPLKAAFKTAYQYKGIKFLNLPASSNFARNFGEPDLRGENSRGYTIVHVRGDEIELDYQMADGGLYHFPENLPEFGPQEWPLWFDGPWQLAVTDSIVNGSFERGLTGWAKQYVYLEDGNPANIRRTTFDQAVDGASSLYLYTRKRGYDVEGDNRMTQTLNTLCQAVQVPADGYPLVQAWFMPDGKVFSADADAGAYILVDGYSGSTKKLNLIYWIGRGYFKPRGLWSSLDNYTHFDITAAPDQWHHLAIDVAGDYGDHHKSRYKDLGLDRLIVQLGVWNLNQRTGDLDADRAMQTGVYWDDIQVSYHDLVEVTNLDGILVNIKPENEIESRWLMGGMGDEQEKK